VNLGSGVRAFSRVGLVSPDGLLECWSVDVSTLPFGLYDLPVFGCDTICLGYGDERSLDPKHRIHARPVRYCETREVGATILGPVCRIPWTCRKCTCNAHNALCNRHGALQPTVTADFAPAIQMLRGLVDGVMQQYVEQYTVWQNEWINKWPACKRRQIDRSVAEDAVMPDVVLSMVKRELGFKQPTKARNIQYYYNLATQAAYGAEFYALQKAWGAVLGPESECWVDGVWLVAASGMNLVSLGDWMARVHELFSRPRFYESDGKNWDACMSEPHMELRRAAYAGMNEGFRHFVERGVNVRGVARVKTSRMVYRLAGTNKSGHNDTYLFNVIVNLSIAYLACRDQGLRACVLALGDDKVVAVDGDFDAERFARFEATCGIVPEWRAFDDWSGLSFISGSWWRNRGGFVFAPKPGRLLAKLWSTVNPPRPKGLAGYRGGVATSLAPTCIGMPVIRALIEPHLANDVGWCDKQYGYITHPHVEWDPTILGQFASRYQVSVPDLLSFESLLRAVANVQCLVVHPVAEAIMAVDLADAPSRPVASVVEV
jgi:hypothetical protein